MWLCLLPMKKALKADTISVLCQAKGNRSHSYRLKGTIIMITWFECLTV